MIRNYFKIAWRTILRNKLHSSINIVGLAVAFSISTILFLMAFFQLSYDSFHSGSKQLYKTTLFTNAKEGMQMSSQVPLPLMPVLKKEIAGIEAVARIQASGQMLTYKDKSIEKRITLTDPDFLEMFSFPTIIGNSKSALRDLQSIALTQSTSAALFGEVDPIGKQVKIGKIGEEKNYTVAAILQDCPRNSSINFDALIRIETGERYNEHKDQWDAYNTSLFIKTAENSSEMDIENKLARLPEKYFKSELDIIKTQHPAGTEVRNLMSLNLTNIEEIHFSGERSTPLFLIYAIIALGVFILLIACFNFVNLNLAKSFKRSREVGVRKSLGALKGQLFRQLWGEAILLYFIGFVAGLFLAYLIIPYFNANFDTNIDLAQLFEPSFLGIMLCVFFMVTLIAGGYPALRLSGIGIIDILKGKTSNKRPGFVRNSLLVGQFVISGLLICVSLIAHQQLDFLRSKPIGFDKENVVSIPIGTQLDGRVVLERIQNELINNPSVKAISGTTNNLGRGRDRRTSRETMDFSFNENYINADFSSVDYQFLKTLSIQIQEGRDFINNNAKVSSKEVIVSESFVKAMGEKSPIGKFIGGNPESGWQIVGVVSDFSLFSPVEETKPFVLHQSASDAINYIFIKTETDKPNVAMANLAAAWSKSTNGLAFNGSFLDENLQSWYEGESFMTRIFGIASFIAIMLSCMGLFAISLIIIELRTKEIGLRKVMGASVNNIFTLVSMSFMKLVAISLSISLPLAWFAMSSWLENYADRITMSPFTFLSVAIIIALVAILTVSYHTLKVALVNPVNSLKSE
jgi:putative ABC transport system permease protein